MACCRAPDPDGFRVVRDRDGLFVLSVCRSCGSTRRETSHFGSPRDVDHALRAVVEQDQRRRLHSDGADV
jgi:hypothetical protein